MSNDAGEPFENIETLEGQLRHEAAHGFGAGGGARGEGFGVISKRAIASELRP